MKDPAIRPAPSQSLSNRAEVIPVALVEGDEAVVGDGHAMRVLAEIAQRMLRAAEGTFRVHNPWGAEQRTQPHCEHLWILKRSQRAVEAEFVLRMQIFKAVHELASEHFF